MRLLATIVTLLGYVTAPHSQVSCGTAEGRSWNEAERVAADAPRGYDSCRGGETAQLGGAECLLMPKGKTASEYQASPAGINFALKPGKKLQSADQQLQSPICYCIWKVPDERLFVRKEIRCGDVPDFFACAFLDGVYVVKR